MEDNNWICTPKDTGVWLHIERHKTKTESRCKLCKKVFKGSWTSTLRYHLENLHGIKVEKTESKEKTAKAPQGAQPSISTMLRAKNDDAGLVLARLCALDRIPFATIANSKDIIAGLKARGLKVPETHKGIRIAVFKFYDSIKEKLKTDIAEKIKNDERFSISLDEYTSLNNRRYMCINLHDEKHVATSLGMVRVTGSLPAEKAVKLIDERLLEFNLIRQKHIVGVVSDGAAMMKKTGRLLEIEHQLCHSHGSHLAVCDLLYKDSGDSQTDSVSPTPVSAPAGADAERIRYSTITFSARKTFRRDNSSTIGGEEEEDIMSLCSMRRFSLTRFAIRFQYM